MKLVICILITLMTSLAFAQSEVFHIKIYDRKYEISSPATSREFFSVIVENKSLSDQVAKIIAGDQLLKFISIGSGKTQSIDLANKTKKKVIFVPVSPAAQEFELTFGKKTYEIPPRK